MTWGGVFKYLSIRKTKGFTLIELLAVIVVLAIIALIAVPIILNIIESARKGAFRDSVYGLDKAAELYTVSSDYDIDEKLEFICDGKTCETLDGKKLNFKGEVPISGSIIIENNIITINYIKNNGYCALGTIENLDIKKDCTKLDATAAEFTLEPGQISSNSILVIIRANDNESGIKNIEYFIDDKTKGIEDKKLVGMVDETYLFEDLDKNTEYQIKVKVTNGNDLEAEKTITIKTKEIWNPNITYTNTPTDSMDGYLERQAINVEFNNINVTTPSYYIKTTRKGISSLNVTESCGTETEPGSCINIMSTNTLNINTWYKVSGNVNVTYSEPSDIVGTLYAITYDGRNYSGASTGSISKIIEPVTGISLNQTNVILENGNTLQLIATIAPNNATNKTITWTSSNTNVASVDNNGLVTTKGLGVTTIIATTRNGKTAMSNITVRDYLSNVVSIGDYVAYDAGVWTETKNDPTSQGEFGGYTIGQNKADSVSCMGGNSYYKGWRVLKIENNQVYLVHAGMSECYYHAWSESGYSASSIAILSNRGSEYLNSTYATSAHIINKEDYDAIPLILRGIGSMYWLNTQKSAVHIYSVGDYGLDGGFVAGESHGIRPVIILKSGIKTSGKTIDVVGNDAWNLIAP